MILAFLHTGGICLLTIQLNKSGPIALQEVLGTASSQQVHYLLLLTSHVSVNLCQLSVPPQ